MRKTDTHTTFACFVKNHTPQPIPLTFPFGEMERRPRLTEIQREAILEENRRRYASEPREASAGAGSEEEGVDDPDLI